MKKLLALILAVLMLATLVACGGEKGPQEDLKDYLQSEEEVDHIVLDSGETYYFDSIDSETITVTGYKSSNEKHALIIPETLNGKTVVAISDSAFKANNDITSVVIPETVTKIGSFVFAECMQITSVTVPASVTEIGKHTFYGCISLETVNIDTLAITEIKAATFFGCNSLTSVTIPANVETIGTAAFYGCEKLETVVISEGVKMIGAQAFQSCPALASLTLPASLTSIGKQAFSGSKALYLEGLTLAEGATVAQDYFKNAEYMLFNKPTDSDTPNDNTQPAPDNGMPAGYAVTTVGGASFAHPTAWVSSQISDVAFLVDTVSGNTISVATADPANTAFFAALNAENVNEAILPLLAQKGIVSKSLAVKQEEAITVITMSNVIDGVTVAQTVIAAGNESATVVITVTERVADAKLAEIIIATLTLA